MQLINLALIAWKPIVEISILWFIFYRIMLFFEGSRAFQVVKGISVLIIAFLVFRIFDLYTLNWLLAKLFGIWLIGVLIIFQPELRHGLARLGERHLLSSTYRQENLDIVFKEIASAAITLSYKKIGALIAFERESRLKSFVESGVLLDSRVSTEIIESIFITTSPLHDGGVIIQSGRIVAASCLFPLSHKPELPLQYGMRHRAAIGLTEETDAAVVIVSEETGRISLVSNGEFTNITDKEELVKRLKALFKKQKSNEDSIL
ncbi:MAG: diadenylate cyclase CdaA [Candidatus Omnitrophota bacterium]